MTGTTCFIKLSQMEDTTYTLEFEKLRELVEKQLIALQQVSDETKVDVSQEIKAIESKLELLKSNIYSDLSPWQRVQLVAIQTPLLA